MNSTLPGRSSSHRFQSATAVDQARGPPCENPCAPGILPPSLSVPTSPRREGGRLRARAYTNCPRALANSGPATARSKILAYGYMALILGVRAMGPTSSAAWPWFESCQKQAPGTCPMRQHAGPAVLTGLSSRRPLKLAASVTTTDTLAFPREKASKAAAFAAGL